MSEVTLTKCGMCGQYYQASEHHKCLLKPTRSNIINAINKATEDAKKPQLIKPLWIEEFEKQIRAEAERDFQNSDYWNDYLAKVIADAKAEAIEEFVRAINSRLLRFVPTDYDDILFIAEQVKEQKND